MRQVCSILAAGFVVAALSVVLVEPVRGDNYETTLKRREIEAIFVKIRNEGNFLGLGKSPDLSPDETFDLLRKVSELSANDGVYADEHNNARDLLDANEISEDKCERYWLGTRLTDVQGAKKKAPRNVAIYLEDRLRKQLSFCARLFEASAAKISESTWKEWRALNETITRVELRDLGARKRDPVEVNFDSMGKAAYDYLVTKGYSPSPDWSETYYKTKFYDPIFVPLCNSDQFEPCIVSGAFREFLGTGFLSHLSQQIQDFVECKKNCYELGFAYWRSNKYRKCLMLPGGKPEKC